ncbi:MAG: hypothetical protein H0X54_09750 [Propionibacteriales bacterium]|jgi:secretion/DNA translocation related CpaE-like protein|nr:hypothetical protein [Propionibacteriales bacterium]
MERLAPTGPPLVVTSSSDLLADLMRLCAAASVTPDVVSDPSHARADWWRAVCVIVGDDMADAVAELELGRRSDVLLVSAQPESAEVWRRGVAVRADRVVVLPAGQSWLVSRLADFVDGRGTRAVTIALVGGCGGAGASTLAAGIAVRAARDGHRALLVDADPLGGGIELLLGCEEASGLRWPEVAATQGRVSAAALREALPGADGVAVLSWDRGAAAGVEPATMRAMVAAGQRGSDLVVVDLPRSLDPAAVEAVSLVDTLLVVCTGDVRVAASAERQLESLRLLCGDIRIVVRRCAKAGVSAADLADSLRLPLAGSIVSQRRIARGINEGLGPVARGRFGAQCRRLLDTVGVGAAVGQPG